MKKLISGFTAVCTAAALAVPVFAASFSDVEGTAYEWAQSYIEEMADLGLISGYSDGTFKPQNTVSKIETISLFARAMGSRSEINAQAVAYAMKEYADLIDSLNLNFGQEDVAFMLYRGVLSESEASAYLSGDVKNQPMQRYEAATIITKAMGAEAEAKRNLVLDMEYNDVSQIPSSAKKYVYYVTQKKIMTGMGDGSFSPRTSVLRSQIAVMLSNTVEALGISFNEVRISSIDTENMILKVKDADSEEYDLKFTQDTAFFVEGTRVQAKDLPADVRAIVTLNTNGVMYVDVNSSIPDQEIYGIFKSYQSISGVLSVVITPPNSSSSETYNCISGIKDITKNGTASTIRDIKDGDYVILTISGGEVVAIKGIDKTSTIKNAKIEAINSNLDKPTIKISHAESQYDGMEIELGTDVRVVKDGEVVDMNSVYRGDTVTLTLEYGVVTKIAAQSNKRTVEGTIRSVNISSAPTIVVMVNGEEQTFDVSNDITISVNGEKGTLYDFRVGDKVTLTLESNAVVKISTLTAQSTSGNINGTVTAVNASFGFIKVKAVDNAGSSYEETVYCKDSKTTFITATGTAKGFKDIKEGNVVSAYGTITNGAFEATSVIIVN